MKVRVKMQQADMPGGLSNLLSLTTNSLQIEDITENSAKLKKKIITKQPQQP